MRRLLHAITSCAVISTACLVGLAAPAEATTSVTSPITYTGTENESKTLYNSGLIYFDGCVIGDDPITCFPDDIPGTVWAHIEAGITTTVVSAAAADVTVQAPDSFRQDTTAPFTTTLVTKDASGKEFKVTVSPWVHFWGAYDAPLANCSKNHVTVQTLLDGIDTSDPGECINVYVDTGQLDIGTFTLLEQDGKLPYTGNGTVSEGHDSPSLTLIDFGFGSIGVHLHFQTDLLLHAIGGFTANRTITGSSDPGTPLVSDPMHWTDGNPLADNVSIPCGVPAGDNLTYNLTDNQWDGNASVDVGISPVLEVPLIDDITLATLSANIFDKPALLAGAPPVSDILGQVAGENKPPTVNLGTIPSDGVEGSPINLTAVGTGPGGSFDNCDSSGNSLDFTWTFDDGTHAFGKSVNHIWNDNNGASSHSGSLTVTDAAGNHTTRNFSVPVANVKPVANAGPDTSSKWGRPVAFNGSATDPGSADQATLAYTWDFGDGSSAGGASTVHSYANPGSYHATLKACDKDGACSDTDERIVDVSARDTTISYVGDLTGTYDTAGTLKATLVDQYGSPVTGRTVSFTVNGAPAGSALTDGAGVATKSFTPLLGAGSYPVAASWAGDTKYASATDSNDSITMGKKATSVTYTGATSGGPNKTVTLSAVLKDATGKALSGKTIVFNLGSQSVQAVTNGTGTASTSLKLNQKNASYPLTATYSPSGGDAANYSGSQAATTFKLQTK